MSLALAVWKVRSSEKNIPTILLGIVGGITFVSVMIIFAFGYAKDFPYGELGGFVVFLWGTIISVPAMKMKMYWE